MDDKNKKKYISYKKKTFPPTLKEDSLQHGSLHTPILTYTDEISEQYESLENILKTFFKKQSLPYEFRQSPFKYLRDRNALPKTVDPLFSVEYGVNHEYDSIEIGVPWDELLVLGAIDKYIELHKKGLVNLDFFVDINNHKAASKHKKTRTTTSCQTTFEKDCTAAAETCQFATVNQWSVFHAKFSGAPVKNVIGSGNIFVGPLFRIVFNDLKQR